MSSHYIEKRRLGFIFLTYLSLDQNLEKYFQKYGKLEEVVIIKEKATGKSNGYGFVTFIVYPYEIDVTEEKK